MIDYTIDSFTSGKKSFIGAYVADLKYNMEDMNNSHSSAYSSLTNSTNEISDPTTIVQSPTPRAMLHAVSSETPSKNRHLLKSNNCISFGYNSCQSSPSSHTYQDDVTDISNLPQVIHDGYNSTSSSVSGMGSVSDQKMARPSRDPTIRNTCASPSTSTSVEIRKSQDDFLIEENILQLYKKEVVIK